MVRVLCRRSTLWLLPVLLLAGCEEAKSANPTSPSIAGPIAGVTISAPKLLQPAAGSQLSFEQQPITLVLANSTSTDEPFIASSTPKAIPFPTF